MAKLSDAEFFLPIIEALEPLNVFTTGATKPQLIRGVCRQNGETGSFVVKYIKAERMSKQASTRELLGSLIAKELGLLAPDPVLINISEEYLDILLGNELWLVASRSTGANFGSEYHTDYNLPLLANVKVNDNLFRNLTDLFAFDMFIRNSDRRKQKPNFLTDGDDLLVIDHELAFSFMMEIPKNREPWIFTENDKVWIKNHFCYDRLKGTIIDFSGFTSKLNCINENFWSKFEEILPTAWRVPDQVDEIKSYLNSITQQSELFSKELTRILLC